MVWFQSFRKNPQEVHYRILNSLGEGIKVHVFNEDPEELQEDEDDEEYEEEEDEDDELYNGFAPFTCYHVSPGQEILHKQQHAFSDCHVGTLLVNCNESRLFLVDTDKALKEKKANYSMMTTISSQNNIDESTKSTESETIIKEEKEDIIEERPVVVNLTLDVRVEDPPSKELPRMVHLVVKAVPATASLTPLPTTTKEDASTSDDDDTVSADAASVQGMLQRLQDIQTMINIGEDVPETLDEMSERSKMSALSERSTLSKLAPYSERSAGTSNHKLSTLSERSRLVSGLEQQLMEHMMVNNNNKALLVPQSERSTSPHKLSTLSERSRLVSGLEQEIRDSMASQKEQEVGN